MDRKKKLETSLEGLFSSGKKRSQSEEKKAPETKKADETGSVPPVEKNPQPAKTGLESKPSGPENSGKKKKEKSPASAVNSPASVEKTQAAAAAQPSEMKPKIPEKNAPVEEKAEVKGEMNKTEAAPEKDENSAPVLDVSKAIQTVESTAIQTVEEAEEGEIQVLVFGIAGVYYGVEVSYVQTIIKPQPVYLVPGTVKFIRGLINLRGEVVPVVDLRTRFGLQRIDVDQETRFVVVELDGVKASMVVDMVQGVITIPNHLIEQPSGVVMNTDTTYLKSVARLDKQLVLNLDLKQTLRRSE